MKVTIIGSRAKDDEAVEIGIEYLQGSTWKLTIGKDEITVTEIESAMKFLKLDKHETEWLKAYDEASHKMLIEPEKGKSEK